MNPQQFFLEQWNIGLHSVKIFSQGKNGRIIGGKDILNLAEGNLGRVLVEPESLEHVLDGKIGQDILFDKVKTVALLAHSLGKLV